MKQRSGNTEFNPNDPREFEGGFIPQDFQETTDADSEDNEKEEEKETLS